MNKTILELEDVKALQPDLSLLKIIPRDVCERIQVIVFAKDKITLKLLTTNNFPDQLQKIIIKLEEKGFKSELHYTSSEAFTYALTWYDQLEQQEAVKTEEIKLQKQAAGKGALAMVKQLFEKRDSMDPGEFIMEIIRLSFQTGASDLHFQPQDSGVLMRIRIDGVLQEILEFTHDDFRKYIQKMKYIAGTKMNIDYVPQDGRFSFMGVDVQGNERKIDCRVSFMPGVLTESTVIRFLDPTKGISTFEKIGFTERTYEILKRNLEKNTGITIITGPTGSGKTTTLYSILNTLNTGERKIITLEDPIEYELPGIQQSQINYSKDYTYELGLKAILRHDPDIILVGETRSAETAESAINAALTGHLVFTTLHTNGAIESIPRLLNMGVKPYMLAPSLNLIVAQRLCRKVCSNCKTKRTANYGEDAEIKESIKKMLDVNPKMQFNYDGQIIQAVGCEICNKTGYIGRIAVVEVFEITDDLRTMIIEGRMVNEMYGKAREMGFLSMKEDGMIKMLDGHTTLDELRRVI